MQFTELSLNNNLLMRQILLYNNFHYYLTILYYIHTMIYSITLASYTFYSTLYFLLLLSLYHFTPFKGWHLFFYCCLTLFYILKLNYPCWFIYFSSSLILLMENLAIPEGSRSLPLSSIILLAIYTASNSLNRYSKGFLLFKGSKVK